MKNNLHHDRELNPGRPRDRQTIYHVAIKIGLYLKAVQVYQISIPGKKLFDVVHFASDLHLNRFCLVRDFAYLMKKSA